MIIVRLMGGLGNQMFQYAAARRLALRHATEVALDLSCYDRYPGVDTPRRYELDKLKVKARIATSLELAEIGGVGLTAPLRIRMFIRRLTGKGLCKNFYSEDSKGFCRQVLTLPDNSYLSGYWQSEQYFKDVADVLRSDFQVHAAPDRRNRKIASEIRRSEAVAIHFRRGDYVENPHTAAFHGVPSPEYYQNAIELIRQKVENPHLFIFSDDPAWVRENLTFPIPATIVDHNPPEQGYEDLRLMSLCRHAVIANSSFSWWGAWLITFPGKLVIAPQRWFADGRATPDLLPNSWVTLA